MKHGMNTEGGGGEDGDRQEPRPTGRFTGWWRSAGALRERGLANFSL